MSFYFKGKFLCPNWKSKIKKNSLTIILYEKSIKLINFTVQNFKLVNSLKIIDLKLIKVEFFR